MKTFEISGTFRKHSGDEKFTKQIKAENEKLANEYAYALIGGKQRIPKKNIIISQTKEAK